MGAGAIWMVAGLGVAALEMLLPGVFLLWLGLAALGTGVLTEAGGLGWHAQLASFVVLTGVLIGLVAMRLRRRPAVDAVNAPAAGLIGQTCRAMDFRGGEGRVALGDGMWPARMAHAGSGGADPASGQTLRVIGLDGTTLLVTPRPGPGTAGGAG